MFKKVVTFRCCWNDLSSLNSKLSNDGTETRSKLNYSTIGFVTFTRFRRLKRHFNTCQVRFFEGLHSTLAAATFFFFCSSLMASLQGISDVKTMPFRDWMTGRLFVFQFPRAPHRQAGAADWLACRGYVRWQTGCRDWQPCLQCWLADCWRDPTTAAEELQWPRAREHSIYSHGETVNYKKKEKLLLLDAYIFRKCRRSLRFFFCSADAVKSFNEAKWDNGGD